MANAKMTLPEDFLMRLSRLGEKTDEITDKVLEAGGQVMLTSVKDKLSSVIGKDTSGASRSTGELERSLGLSKVRRDRNGNADIKVGFSEPRSDGDSNAKIANILEYGRHGQVPKPFLKPAKKSAQNACREAMIRTFDEEVDKI